MTVLTIDDRVASLAEADYATSAQLEIAQRLAGTAPPEALAARALDAFARTFPARPTLAHHDQLSRFASWLVLACGPSAAREAISGAPDSRASGELRAILGLPCHLAPPGPEIGRAMAPKIRNEGGIWRALAYLASRPAPVAPALAELLENLEDERLRHELAMRAMAGPFDGECRSVAARYAPDPADVPGFAGNWPVRAAYATAPDGYGSQTLFIVRERTGGLAIVGAIASSVRGIADAIVDRRLSSRRLLQLLLRLREAHGELYEVPTGYAMGRIRQGEALAERQGMPLPFEYKVQRELLAGLWDLPEPPIPLRAWTDPAADVDAGALLDRADLSSWFLTEADGPAVATFLRKTAQTMHRARPGDDLDTLLEKATREHVDACLAVRSGPPGLVLRDPAANLADRLEQVAFLCDCAGHLDDRARAASAALALRSREPLAGQPFPRRLMAASFAESEYGWLFER